MAENDDSLIGYDPLAWLHNEAVPVEAADLASEDAPEVRAEQSDEPPLAEQVLLEPEQGPEAMESTCQVDTTDDTPVADFNDSVAVVLDAVQTIQTVGKLHERLLHELDKSRKIEIDASAVTSIDTASLQLLLVLKQSAIKLQKEVVIDFPSDKFIDAAELLGVAEMLEVDQAAAGFF